MALDCDRSVILQAGDILLIHIASTLHGWPNYAARVSESSWLSVSRNLITACELDPAAAVCANVTSKLSGFSQKRDTSVSVSLILTSSCFQPVRAANSVSI